MLQFLHISRCLDKQLDLMRKNDRKAEAAALKCETIIGDIRKLGCQADEVAGKRTRNGELRIKNCVKYNLSSGYRLITIKVGGHLLVPFAGTHDDSDKWIERHRCDDFAPDETFYRCEELDNCEADDSEDLPADEPAEPDIDIYEAQLQERLDEACLREIFQGLCMS